MNTENKYDWADICLEVGQGWLSLLDDLFSEMNEVVKDLKTEFVLAQVKSKYAELRVYYYIEDEIVKSKIDEIIEKYENIAEKTCELCGEPGKLVNLNNYLVIMCEKCKRNIKK